MMNFLQILMKRPTDKNIRIGKVLFWLIITGTAYFTFFINDIAIQESIFWSTLTTELQNLIKYLLVALWIIPLLLGAFDINLVERKYARILQIVYAIILFWYSGIIIGWAKLWMETLYFVLAFIPLIGWITGKFITKKWLKAKQKITKIRV